jgi:uncharacterized protein
LNFTAWQWFLAVIGTLLVGISKTGITGLSLLFVSIFASIMPARRSTGMLVPLLIVADVVAVLSYRQHAKWAHLWRLFPWAAGGVVIGFFALGRMDDRQSRFALAAIILSLATLHLYRRLRPREVEARHGAWFAPTIGVLAGFTTLVANASGPLVIIYLLAMRLPKAEIMGTGSVFFLLLNLFKLPFMVGLGLVNRESLMVNLVLAPAVLVGTLLGKWLFRRLNQKMYENTALALTLFAGAKMLFF